MANRSKRTDRARERFIAVLSDSCNVSEAARAIGIGRTTAYEWKRDDKEFSDLWDEAEQYAADRLEREAWRRAVDGVDEPVFHKGEVVGHVRKYSDRMLEILLKGHRGEKYVEKRQVEHSGGVAVVAVTDVDEDL